MNLTFLYKQAFIQDFCGLEALPFVRERRRGWNSHGVHTEVGPKASPGAAKLRTGCFTTISIVVIMTTTVIIMCILETVVCILIIVFVLLSIF